MRARIGTVVFVLGVIALLALAIVVNSMGTHPRSATLTATATPVACAFPQDVQTITFSRVKYPNIYQHYVDATNKGWPVVLIKDTADASTNRVHLPKSWPTKTGEDRDEYPPAAGREGWLGDVEYVPSSENRSQGASMGAQLSRYCDGVRFKYVWTG